MSEHEAGCVERGAALAIAELLGPALEEIRWLHPALRASCGAFADSAVRILATSHPEATPPRVGIQAAGPPATLFAELLQDAQEVSTSDVREHAKLRAISPAILGEDTRAIAIVPVRSANDLVGFLRLDALGPGQLDRRAVERLHELAPLAAAAILLEQERARSQRHVSRVQQLRTAMCRQTVREREAALELKQAAKALREVVESVAPKLGHTERDELSALIRACAEHVTTAANTLTDAADPLVDEGRRTTIARS